MNTLNLVLKIAAFMFIVILIASLVIAPIEEFKDLKRHKKRNSDYTLSDHDWKGFKNHHLN